MQDSDENEEQTEAIDGSTLEVLQSVIVNVKETLTAHRESEWVPSVYDQDFKEPLGVERLGAI